MKTIKYITLSFFTLLLGFITNTAHAQDLSFSIERSSGIFAIYEGGKNVTALYEVKLAEFDIYNEDNKYMGTIRVNNNKISPAELRPKEHLKISKIQLVDKNTNTSLNIDAKKSYQITLK